MCPSLFQVSILSGEHQHKACRHCRSMQAVRCCLILCGPQRESRHTAIPNSQHWQNETLFISKHKQTVKPICIEQRTDPQVH